MVFGMFLIFVSNGKHVISFDSDILLFFDTAPTAKQRPVFTIAATATPTKFIRPSSSGNSTGIQVLENVVLRPAVLNTNFGSNAAENFDDLLGDFDVDGSLMNDSGFNDLYDSGMDILEQGDQLLNGV